MHHRLPPSLPSTVAVSLLPRPIYEESISPFASRVSQRMTHWWGLISPKCAKGERETVQSEQEAEGKREGGEDKCNGLAIKRKVDGMHTEEQNMGKKVGRGKEEKLRICAHSTRRYSTRKGTSLSQRLLQQLECRRAFSNAKFSKSRDIYLIVSSARARTAVATTAAAAAPSGPRRAKSVGRTHSLGGCEGTNTSERRAM